MIDLWYKNAVIYCLDVDVFMDSNGDGVGDFQGLINRLDHLESLGVTCVWLMPFYPSPNRDNGYDITDYYSVDPRLGSLGDFVQFTRAARNRGLRVIIDLVVNHTSVDHPWFQSARSDPNSPFRDWYIWSKDKPADAAKGIVFPGVQESTWTWDSKAKAYYFHRFYKFQADLNITNQGVREEIQKIMGFWLELGVSGFRIDAVPFLIEYKGLAHQPDSDPHAYLTEMHEFLSWRRAEAIMLAEANIPMDQSDEYFGDGDRMSMVFHFMLNQKLFLALARGDGRPVTEMLQATPKIPPIGQWAHFLRNHDEIDLGRLSTTEQQEVFAAFGPEPTMQIYDRGIRRRLAPMLGGDHRHIAVAFSLMFALPGTPVLWFGDEIGMGEDLSLEERNSVRTPMQWNGRTNAGFSSASADKLERPVVDKGPFDYRTINAAAQRDEPNSLMEQIRLMIRERRSHPELGWGECKTIETDEPCVVALTQTWQGNTVLTLHNLAARAVEVRLDLKDDHAAVRRLLTDIDTEAPERTDQPIRLPSYGYCWLKLDADSD